MAAGLLLLALLLHAGCVSSRASVGVGDDAGGALAHSDDYSPLPPPAPTENDSDEPSARTMPADVSEASPAFPSPPPPWSSRVLALRPTWARDNQRFQRASRLLLQRRGDDVHDESLEAASNSTEPHSHSNPMSHVASVLAGLLGIGGGCSHSSSTGGSGSEPAASAKEVAAMLDEVASVAVNGHAPAIHLLASLRLFGLRVSPGMLPTIPPVLLKAPVLRGALDPGAPGCGVFADWRRTPDRLRHVYDPLDPASSLLLTFADTSAALLATAVAACLAQHELLALAVHAAALDEGGAEGLAAVLAVESPLLALLPPWELSAVRSRLARGLAAPAFSRLQRGRSSSEYPSRGDDSFPWVRRSPFFSYAPEEWQAAEGDYESGALGEWVRRDASAEFYPLSTCLDDALTALALAHLARLPVAASAYAALVPAEAGEDVDGGLHGPTLVTKLREGLHRVRRDILSPLSATVYEVVSLPDAVLRMLTGRHPPNATVAADLDGGDSGANASSLLPPLRIFPTDPAAWDVLELLARRHVQVAQLMISHGLMRG